MEGQPAEKAHYTLFELNGLIKSVISGSFPDAYWVAAEIADLKCNQKGHCYIELVEKKEDKTIAQIKATIWAYEYRKLGSKFEKATGEPLKPGMRVLLRAEVTFHEVYGLSLNIRDVDPAYTLGEMARKKKEVIERLRKEGIIGLNKSLPLPLVPQRIAVISSPTAAGYGDFFRQLDRNAFGYRFAHVLFPALMQGQEAEQSVVSALEEIKKNGDGYDLVVIIRGGGSVIDLNCFDGYGIAAHIAKFPLPVITGIGHEKDDTVADMVAHTKLKTPTAVAEFLISGMRGFEERILDIQERTLSFTERFLKDKRYELGALGQRLSFLPVRLSSLHGQKLAQFRKDLEALATGVLKNEESRCNSLDQAIRHLDPANVLRRGYSITRHKGKVLKDAADLKKWAVIETRLSSGRITSIVQDKKEAEKGEQGKTDNLLPGFE
ncbi:MAG: exodeoxyribonuclease VII large subunit [Nitrospiraceae bacterium]|nr:exodeoxyribonuclease VII large subunit [Nitrospiraceae bacterium]